MPPVVTPFVPQRITVHIGPPSSGGENITVSFADYVKNVAFHGIAGNDILPGQFADAFQQQEQGKLAAVARLALQQLKAGEEGGGILRGVNGAVVGK